MPSSSNVELGPGTLYVGPIGTAEPTSATGTLDPAYRQVGYTENGNTFNYQVTVQDVNVAEVLDPIKVVTTGRAGSVVFQMAEITAQNLALALNAGAGVAAGSTAAIEPPDPGTELRVILLFQSTNGALWIFRQCVQAGSLAIISDKAPAKRLLAVDFKLEKPNAARPFKVYPAADGTV